MNSEIVNPDPARMIEGLRDTGYEFNTAIADIIDNSIAANATIVDITIKMDLRGNVRTSIADNGTGMDRTGLINAMKYGSSKRADPSSLGKFGLGLKTASTAFCRQLSVTSCASNSADLLTATWDLDHVAQQGKWELLFSEPDSETKKHFADVAGKGPGTVVVWLKVDRLLKTYQEAGGKFAQNALKRTIDGLREHVAMVFQRFLDPKDSRARNVQIRVNSEAVDAWDPFCVGESELVGDETKTVEFDSGKDADFIVRAYVLPRQEEFSNDAARKRARLTNDRQGIYIYRENRLIHDADWLNMFQKEPHGTLLRVEFSFTNELDEAFHVDIKKSRILLNEDLWNWLNDEFVPGPRRAANDRYRKGLRKLSKKASEGAHDGSNASIGSKEGELDTANVQVVNAQTGDVEVTNAQGRVRLKLKIGKAMRPGECFVQPVDGLDDGVLWQPALIEGHKAVQINTGHPYYHKVYVPNLTSGVTIQGMDSLLWAICAAELGTVNEATKQHFAELRFEVSKLLRRLVEDLPEPEIQSDDGV
jgi:hypothetical protein